MIELYSGTPGSGKSLDVAKRISEDLRFNRSVIANFPINLNVVSKNGKKKIGEFIYLKNTDLNPQYLIEYAKKYHSVGKEGQTLFVVDEAGIVFNSRDYGSSNRKQWIDFFMTHRHYGYNVILISQVDRLIDRQIRAFIEYDIKHRKANNFKSLGFFLTLLRIPLFTATTYWYGQRERIGGRFFRYRKKDGRLYDTMMLFDDNHGETIGNPNTSQETNKPTSNKKQTRKAMLAQRKQKNALNSLLNPSNPVFSQIQSYNW